MVGASDGSSALQLAIRNGHQKVCRVLIEDGANVNAANKAGFSVLTEAVQLKSEATVELLLCDGTDADAKTPNRKTPLHFAAETGAVNIVTLLLERVKSVDSVDDEYCTPIMLAARGGHTRVIGKLLQHQGWLHHRGHHAKMRALNYAARNGHVQACRLLLSTATDFRDFDEEDYEDSTTLLDAIRGGHHEIVKLLLAKNPNFLEETYDGGFAMHLTAELGLLDMMEILLDTTQCVDNVDDHYMTPLMVAAKFGHVAIARRLLQMKANVKRKCWNENSALHFAAGRGSVQICRLLLKNGADLSARNSADQTPLMMATLAGHSDVAQFLVVAGVNASGRNARPALHHAATIGDLGLIEHLVKNGADLDDMDARGLTPLMVATEVGNADAIEPLLKLGTRNEGSWTSE